MGTLYENIKLLCDERGIKPGRMCVETGVSKGLISDLKAGRKKTVQIGTATKIANYFNVPVESLLSETDAALYSTAKDAVLIRAFDSLPTEEKEARLGIDLDTKKEAPAPIVGGECSDLVNGDPELTAYLDSLRNRPELRLLFSVAKGATKADVEKTVAIIEALRKTEE